MSRTAKIQISKAWGGSYFQVLLETFNCSLVGLISTSVETGGFHLATSSLVLFSSTSAGPFNTVQLGGRNRQTHFLFLETFLSFNNLELPLWVSKLPQWITNEMSRTAKIQISKAWGGSYFQVLLETFNCSPVGLISTSVETATSSLVLFSSTWACPFHTVQLVGRNRQSSFASRNRNSSLEAMSRAAADFSLF